MLLTPMMFQDAGAAPGADGGMGMLMQLAPLLFIFVIFYFLLIRPQNQRMKKHRAMLEALKKGDTVVTQGGVIGKIVKLADDEVTIDNGEGVKLRFVRSAISDVRNKGEPAPANDAKEG
jgi:preprotein translocase subunit YajC